MLTPKGDGSSHVELLKGTLPVTAETGVSRRASLQVSKQLWMMARDPFPPPAQSHASRPQAVTEPLMVE